MVGRRLGAVKNTGEAHTIIRKAALSGISLSGEGAAATE
jgi:hypothetical protein